MFWGLLDILKFPSRKLCLILFSIFDVEMQPSSRSHLFYRYYLFCT